MSRPTDNTAHARIQWEIEQGIVARFLFPAQLSESSGKLLYT